MPLTLAPEAPPLRQEPDGTVRVGPSRVTLDFLVEAYRAGETADDLAARLPTLAPADVYGAIAYALRHPAEVDEYLARRDARAAEVEAIIRADQRPFPTREELLARRAARDATGAAGS